jgi:hypothetical protein
MDENVILLKNNTSINLLFIKECAEIVKNHSEEFSCCNNDFERQELLENLWIKIHKSKFDKDKIVFENNNDMMMFILKNQ